jgi:CelD/BcsL family acetyltransferase involved in cellulose biosynthesis
VTAEPLPDERHAAPHRGPTSDPAWTRICVETFGLAEHPVAVDGARAPLALNGTRLELVGAELFEPVDFDWRDEDALDAVAAAVAAARRPVWLARIPTDSPAIAALRRHMRLVVERDAASCPVIALDPDPLTLLGSRRRHDLRRAARRAAELGPVRAEVVAPSPDEVDPLVDRAFAVEANGWKGRSGTALVLDPQRAHFYRAYARAAAGAGTLRLAFLTVGGVPAAMQVAVERDDALWLLKIGYDERFASCSPGHLLLRHTLEWAVARGLGRFEFLGTAAPWTRLWTREEWRCSAVAAYPPNLLGAVTAIRDGRRHANRWARR